MLFNKYDVNVVFDEVFSSVKEQQIVKLNKLNKVKRYKSYLMWINIY